MKLNARQRESLWRPEFGIATPEPPRLFAEAFDAGGAAADVNRVQRADLETFLPQDILCKVDVASMWHGLEVRPPMLDRRFFDVCSSIPTAQLYSYDPISGEYCGKLPLKRLLGKKLGDDFAFRPKQGFTMPLQEWFNTDVGRQHVRDLLLPSTADISAWFNPEAVQELVQEGDSGNTWILLVLEEWLGQAKSGKFA